MSFLPSFLERAYLAVLLVFRPVFRLRGGYRLPLRLYPFGHPRLRGQWLTRPYLAPSRKLRIHLFSKDAIDHKILFTGAYEPFTNAVLERHIRPGDHVFEAGANSGTETLLMARLVGEHGKVTAFEPVPHVAQKLRRNLELNGITNVELRSEALGAEEKDVAFFVTPPDFPNQGMGSLRPSDRNNPWQEIRVRQTTLDRFMETERVPRLDFLKMDIQGAEEWVLRGGLATLARFRPAIFLEAWQQEGDLRGIHELLTGLGYVIHKIDRGGRLVALPRADQLLEGEWLCLGKPGSPTATR